MYNLTVDEAHTFFVGDGEWVVHNCPKGIDGSPEPNRPDLTSVEKDLKKIFDKPESHPTKFGCVECAESVATVLSKDGFDVDYVQIQNKHGMQAVDVYANSPDGNEWVIGKSGFHEVVRIKHEGQEFFIDSVAYQHNGVKALTREEYAQLMSVDAPIMAYFQSRTLGSSRSLRYDQQGNSIPNQVGTGMIKPSDIKGPIRNLGDGSIIRP